MHHLTLLRAALGGALLAAAALSAQEPARQSAAGAMTLHEARERARRYSPDVRAAREALAAARARARQAGAFPNPTLSYGREQTSRAGESNVQDVVAIEQAVELGGQRGARRDAARLRRDVAEARLRAAEAHVDFEVTRAYAGALAADRRAALADQAATAFASARTVSERRLAAGDVSGYANRRIRLEATRYAALRAEALHARRAARLGLASLVAASPDSVAAVDIALGDSLMTGTSLGAVPVQSLDSLRALALRDRPELRAAMLEADVAAAEARVAGRERIPVPVVSAGMKREDVAGGGGSFSGFVAGVSVPLPLWDRRRSALDASHAEARRRAAETEAVRRRTVREVEEAYDALRATLEQVELLRSQLGAEASAALRAAQVAYAEGEISLVEWLDAVRAYQEAETTFAGLRADALIRGAALERAVGTSSLSPSSGPAGGASTERNNP